MADAAEIDRNRTVPGTACRAHRWRGMKAGFRSCRRAAPERPRGTKSSANNFGKSVSPSPSDMTDPASIAALFAKVIEVYACSTCCSPMSGIGAPQPLRSRIEPRAMAGGVEHNLTAPFSVHPARFRINE